MIAFENHLGFGAGQGVPKLLAPRLCSDSRNRPPNVATTDMYKRGREPVPQLQRVVGQFLAPDHRAGDNRNQRPDNGRRIEADQHDQNDKERRGQPQPDRRVMRMHAG